MSATLRVLAQAAFEDKLVEASGCLDCDRPRGLRCRDRVGRERVTCCQARYDFGRPILEADLRVRLWLDGVAQ